MAEVEISPLAKRLAVENNVDWHSLRGSGDDGRIVERDVLDYLARVMAGDEAADPTPEPLPDGMEAWPDRPTVENEAPGWSVEEDTASSGGGEDDLLEVESAAGGGPSNGSDDWSRREWGADDWGAGGQAGANGEDDDFFSGVGDLGGEQQAATDEGTFDFGGDGDETSGSRSETEGDTYELGGDAAGSGFDFGGEPAGEDTSLFDTSSMEPAIDEGIFVFDDEEATPATTQEDAGGSLDEPAIEARAAEDPARSGDYDYLDRSDESLPEGLRIEEDEQRVVRSPVGRAAAVAATVGPVAKPERRVQEARGVVSSGVVLRREVDLSAVIEAARSLSLELGGEPSLSAFLLRAAARAGKPWPLAGDGDEAGIATLSDEGVSVTTVPDAALMSFRDLSAAAANPAAEAGEPALAVADVSELGIDEAVLDLGLPVLTIGRVLESDGERLLATLTLSGLSTPESGSRFLARVAELLAAPVRLVL